MTLAAMSGKRTLQEWRVRTNSCLYLSVSSCSVTLFVLITSFFKTITSWKTNRCHYICRIFPFQFVSMLGQENDDKNVDTLCMPLTSSTLRDETRSSASCRVFFLTSRSGVLRTRRMSITRSWIKKKQPQEWRWSNLVLSHNKRAPTSNYFHYRLHYFQQLIN